MTGPDEGGEVAMPSPRRHRRAVGPAGASPAAPAEPVPGESEAPEPAEDDDERLLREVPPHHGA